MILSHLRERHLNPELYPTSLVTTDKDATFLLYDLSGRLNGYQVYNPDNPSRESRGVTGRHLKYYTYRDPLHNAIWGLEFPLNYGGYLFVVEGVFDAARLHSMGLPAVAVLCNNPAFMLSQFKCLPVTTVALCDGDESGKALGYYTNLHEHLPDGTDVNSVDELILNKLLEKYRD